MIFENFNKDAVHNYCSAVVAQIGMDRQAFFAASSTAIALNV
jgi:hypothetical protein